jgi:flagellar biosynthesis protein
VFEQFGVGSLNVAKNANSQAPKPMLKAAALAYEPGVDAAPRLVAIGQGHIAEQILRIAEKNSVPVLDNQPVVQALTMMGPGEEIPVELYRAVAEVLAFVYRLKDEHAAPK